MKKQSSIKSWVVDSQKLTLFPGTMKVDDAKQEDSTNRVEEVRPVEVEREVQLIGEVHMSSMVE